MPADPRPVTPSELRKVRFKTAVRGYDSKEVEAMLLRSAAAIEHLLVDPVGANIQSQASMRELRNDELPTTFRGVQCDEVNAFSERAASTIERLLPGEKEVMQGRDAAVEVAAQVVTSPPAAVALVGSGALATPERRGHRDSIRVALGARTYHVVVGEGLEADLVAAVQNHGARRVALVTQPSVESVAKAYSDVLSLHDIPNTILSIDDGEAAKTLPTVDTLCRSMAEFGLLRGDAVVAVGGGVVGDITGFTASVYYRGIAVVQVPTTLLAMVDAAIGGKTAANLPQGKNLIGAFHQPIAVLCNPTSLTTLTDREFRCGLGEVLKYALMGDAELMSIVATESAALLARESSVLQRAITRSAAVKARFVSADERERTGLREHLNYGHTLAHAIETAADHALAHGEAVAVGLVFAGALASALERITPEAATQHRVLAEALGLPVTVPPDLKRSDLVQFMRRDKKAVGGLRFVLQGPNGLERVDNPSDLALDVAFSAVGLIH